MMNDTMSSFSVKKYCRNTDGIKVTKYIQLVYTVASDYKVGPFLRNEI